MLRWARIACHREEKTLYKTVVFDLDGTLLDTLEDLYLAVNHALAAHGLPMRTRDEVRLATGNGIALLIARSVPEDCADDLRERVFSDFKAYYGLHAMDHTAPYPGMRELVARLRAAGVRVAVVSNKADFAVQKIIAATFPGDFDCVMGENEAAGIPKKPARQMVDAALAAMGGRSGAVAYVGDSEVDVATAANADCDCVACTWGFRSPEWLREAGATLLVDTPSELERVLLA